MKLNGIDKKTGAKGKTTSTKLSSFVKLHFIGRKLIVLSKRQQRVLYFAIVILLVLLFAAFVVIVLWEVQIGVVLSDFQTLLGLHTTILLPTSVALASFFFVLVPTLITFKAMIDVRSVEFEFVGTHLLYLMFWLQLVSSLIGFLYVGLKFGEVYDTNVRLKRSLLKYSHLYAANEKTTVNEINVLNEKFTCCGVESDMTWTDDVKLWHPRAELAVPHSCCDPSYKGPCYNEGLYGNYSREVVKDSIYLQGCRQTMNRYFHKIARPILFVLVVTFFMQLFIALGLLIFVQNYVVPKSRKRPPAKKIIRARKRTAESVFAQQDEAPVHLMPEGTVSKKSHATKKSKRSGQLANLFSRKSKKVAGKSKRGPKKIGVVRNVVKVVTKKGQSKKLKKPY